MKALKNIIHEISYRWWLLTCRRPIRIFSREFGKGWWWGSYLIFRKPFAFLPFRYTEFWFQRFNMVCQDAVGESWCSNYWMDVDNDLDASHFDYERAEYWCHQQAEKKGWTFSFEELCAKCFRDKAVWDEFKVIRSMFLLDDLVISVDKYWNNKSIHG